MRNLNSLKKRDVKVEYRENINLGEYREYKKPPISEDQIKKQKKYEEKYIEILHHGLK